MDSHHIDRCIRRALTTFSGSAERWASFRQRGLDDNQLKQAICYELGIQGGSSVSGVPDVSWVEMGAGTHRNWSSAHITIRGNAPSLPLTFRGQRLLEKARRVFQIAHPELGLQGDLLLDSSR